MRYFKISKKTFIASRWPNTWVITDKCEVIQFAYKFQVGSTTNISRKKLMYTISWFSRGPHWMGTEYLIQLQFPAKYHW